MNEGYNFVHTGRLQTDPLERRFSQYRQMSGGRFLVSLKEVYRSEYIIKVKTLLTNNIEITTITSSLLTDEQSIAVENLFNLSSKNTLMIYPSLKTQLEL